MNEEPDWIGCLDPERQEYLRQPQILHNGEEWGHNWTAVSPNTELLMQIIRMMRQKDTA